tara:strand:- start:4741 stop:5040 length:300 start_codon:yes stop_codon:yes gene_type:complete
VNKLAQIGCAETSERLSRAILCAKNGVANTASNPIQQSLSCGHDEKHAYRYAGNLLCKKCRRKQRYDDHRINYLPIAYADTKRKMEALEREARERGVIL